MRVNCTGTTVAKTNHLFRSPFKKTIPWDPNPANMNYNAVYFDHFLPPVKAKMTVLDEIIWDPRCEYYYTVVKNSICFHCPDDKNPDRQVSVREVFIRNIPTLPTNT